MNERQRITDVVNLTWQAYYAQTVIPGQMLPGGIFHEHFSTTLPLDFDGLVMQLKAYVLKNDGGEPKTASVVVDLPIKPRWYPRWLWRRIPTRKAEWVLTVTPEWTYPSADIKIPQMSPAVRLSTQDFIRGDGEWKEY